VVCRYSAIVGLPEPAVKESKDRVRGALLNSHFRFPAGRVTINLAPADLPKEGGRFDLPIAVGVLGASGQLASNLLDRLELIGKLALSGSLRPVTGVLPVALAARDAGRALLLPRANADETALVSGLTIYPAEHLLQVCEHINGTTLLPSFEGSGAIASTTDYADLAEVRGQEQTKRAPERRHFSRNPKWGPSDFGCKKSGNGHSLRRPTFVLRPSRRALRAAPGLPQGLDAVSRGLAFRLRRRSRTALRRNARPYGYAGVVALRSSLTLPRFPVLLPGRDSPSPAEPGATAARTLRPGLSPDNLRWHTPFADLAASERIEPLHLSEAIGYRRLDRADPTNRAP